MESNIIAKYGSLTASRILEYFRQSTFFKLENEEHPYTFIVLGRRGPTGKTWLCEGLKKNGFNAIELAESILPLVDYRDDENHIIRDYVNKTIVIVLNKSLGV